MGCVIALVLVNKHFDMFGQRRMFRRRDGMLLVPPKERLHFSAL